MSNQFKTQIKLTNNKMPNPASYIFPFKKSPIFDFSENTKIKTLQQDFGNNDSSSSGEKKDDSLNLEQTLSKFYDYSLDCYKKKMYETLIKEIEINEYLYYVGSRESFDILIIKIKCFMKLIIEEYENDLNNINEIKIPIKEYILKIENEFLNLEKIIDIKDSYQYEIITQIYCKFLIYLIKISQKREEYCKSVAYIALGINMIKIFFIKKKVTKDIKTYKRYIYLLLLLINQLIGEKNFKRALLYCENLLKVIEMAIKTIYGFKPKDNKLKEKNYKSIIELFRCIGITYLYIGICFENQKNLETAMEAYKESFYFFMKIKSHLFSKITINNEKSSYDTNFVKISHLFVNNQKFKIEEEKRKKEDIINKSDIMIKNEQKKELYEKRKKLKLISSGLYGDQNKYKQIENKIYKEILTPKNQKVITKLDKALMSLAYSENKYKNKKGSLKKSLSLTIMDTLCHYNLYDKLMSSKYHEFIISNNNLKLSNPRDQEEFIQNINSYLTSTMEIKPHNDNNTNQKTLYKGENKNISLLSGNISKNKGKISSARSPRKTNLTNSSIINFTKHSFTNNNNKNSKKILFKKNISLASLRIDTHKTGNNYLNSHTINKSLSETYITSRTVNKKNSKSKINSYFKTKTSSYTDYKHKSNSKKNIKKSHYLSPKYFKKYMHLDQLTKKELDFQKIILNLKSNNSKLYYKDFSKELFITGKNKEEEENRNYLIINEKINEKVLKYQKEYEKMINNKIKRQETKNYKYLLKLNKGENLFKGMKNSSGGNLEFDFFNSKKRASVDYKKEEDYKKNNEKSILSLDEKIRNIRNKINERKKKLKYN